jgi:hypothetical protein
MTASTPRILTYVALFFGICFAISCNDSPTSQSATDYDKLCQIYKDVAHEPIDLRMKEVKILERVQKELPDFFNANFVHITKAKPDKRYQFIKQLAEQETKKSWNCETIKSYYANEFK